MDIRNEANWENPNRPWIAVNNISDYGMAFFEGKKPTKVQMEGGTIRVWFQDETKTPPVPEKLWVETVLEITRGRRDNYGRPLINFCRIALLWSTYYEQPFSLQDVALMMDLLKTARLMHGYTEDGFLDKIGYLDCVNDMLVQLNEMGYTADNDFTAEEALRERSTEWLNTLLGFLIAPPKDASDGLQTLGELRTGLSVQDRHGYDHSSLGQ